MCHGLIEQRVTISVPDLLRNQCYQIPEYGKKEDNYPSLYNSGSINLSVIEDTLLPESSGLSEDALADIVKDYSFAVKKFDSDDVDIVEADALASTGSLSTWFDCIKEDFCSAADSISPKAPLLKDAKLQSPQEEKPAQDFEKITESVPKSRKSRKSAVKEQSHAQHDSDMDDGAPVLIDEKRKRRMSSNRASAQRSRQRKQERLDELEILTAQLRLENATLSRRSKMAEQLAKKIEQEKNELAKKVEELRRELELARHPHSHHHSSSDSGDDSNSNYSNTSGNLDSGVCDMVEGAETSPDELQAFTKDNNNVNVVTTMKLDARKRNISCTDIFQELYDAIDSDQFDLCLATEVTDLLQEEWYGSFTECLNAA